MELEFEVMDELANDALKSASLTVTLLLMVTINCWFIVVVSSRLSKYSLIVANNK